MVTWIQSLLAKDSGSRPVIALGHRSRNSPLYYVDLLKFRLGANPLSVELNLLGERLVLQGSCAFFALFMVNIVSVLCTARCSVFLIWSSESILLYTFPDTLELVQTAEDILLRCPTSVRRAMEEFKAAWRLDDNQRPPHEKGNFTSQSTKYGIHLPSNAGMGLHGSECQHTYASGPKPSSDTSCGHCRR
jgi:hypothetical protein